MCRHSAPAGPICHSNRFRLEAPGPICPYQRPAALREKGPGVKRRGPVHCLNQRSSGHSTLIPEV